MSGLPSIGVVTTSTNSISRGYYSFLACVDTWSRIADQMIIVDGGTDDNTYDVLRNWTRSYDYSIFSSPETNWDLHGRFHLAQWGINTRIGMEQLQTDWAVIVPGDHVLDADAGDRLRKELASHNDSLAMRFRRLRHRFGSIETDFKFYILNLKKIRAEGLQIAWGFDRQYGSCPDDPIMVDEETAFLDAVTGVCKRHLGGITLGIKDHVESITCWSYGFYFFTREQALAHLKDFHLCYNCRYFGRPLKTERWLMRRERLQDITGFVSREDELKKQHPPAIRRLIEHFYKPEMIGTAVYRAETGQNIFIQNVRRLVDYLHTLWFMQRGFPSVKSQQQWFPLGEASRPLDLAQLYKEQDAFL